MGHYLSEMISNDLSEHIDPKERKRIEKRREAESVIEQLLKETPLKMRLNVLNDMMLQSHLVDIGVIPDGFWSDEKEKKYGKLWRKFAKKLSKHQMNIF